MPLLERNYLEVRSFLSESWSLGWPMILMMFFQFAIGLTDVYVAGYLGTDIMAAVGYVAQLYFTLIILANAVTVGTVSLVSQAYGAKSEAGVRNIASTSLLLGLAISGLMTVLAQVFAEPLVWLAGMPEGIQPTAVIFMRIFSLVLIPSYMMFISSGILRASGRMRIAMMNSAVAAIANVAGTLLLGLGWESFPGIGFRGIAWASAIATTLGMVLNLYHVTRGPGRVCWRSFSHPQRPCLRNVVKLGFPSVLQQTAWNFGTLVVYFLVGQLQMGQITALAAMTAGLRIEALIFLPVFAFNMAAAVLTGNRLGAGDLAGARSGAKAASFLCIAIVSVPALLIFIFAPVISALLTEDPAVLAEMTRYLRINMLSTPFMAIGITLSGALQGAGDTFGTMRIIFTGMWLIRIPLILFVIHVVSTGAQGVWWCMTFSIIMMSGLLVNRFRGKAWTKASVDRKTQTMLWEACLGQPASSESSCGGQEDRSKDQAHS
jgi:multidrug resistance protein, MATE family